MKKAIGKKMKRYDNTRNAFTDSLSAVGIDVCVVKTVLKLLVENVLVLSCCLSIDAKDT